MSNIRGQVPSFTLITTGLTPQLAPDGTINLVDGKKTIAVIPAGTMADKAGSESTGVRYALDQLGPNSFRLRLTLDSAWLTDKVRTFPVTVDPSVGQFNANTDDTYVSSVDQSNHSGQVDLQAGRVAGGLTRSYLHFNNPASNSYILASALDVDAIDDTDCRPHGVTAFEVTQGWSGSAAWPGAAVGQALGSAAPFVHGGNCGAPAYVAIPLNQDFMTRFTHGQSMQNGISLRASNEADSGGMRFGSANSANAPYLDLRYAPEGAAYEVTDVLQPTNNRAGHMTVKVTNWGSSTWTAGNGFHFGYTVQPINRTSNTFALPGDVGPGQTTTMTVPIDPVAPGTYQVYLSMWNPSGQDFHSVYETPNGQFQLKVDNVPPTSNYQQPASGDVVQSLTPTLYAEGIDDDNWPPNARLRYKFIICTDQALTQNCQGSSDWGDQSWAPDPGKLFWETTYYWGVKVNDGVDTTPNWVELQLQTRVPQPEITSHLAGSPGTVEGPGLDPQIGNYSLTNTDAAVPTVGPDLTIGRTYNSLDPRRDTAFGIGWASRVDMKLTQDADNSGNVVLTYPSGKQVRFGRNPDGSFHSPFGDSTALVQDTTGHSAYFTLRDSSGSQWWFDAALRLKTIVDPAGLQENLIHDDNDRLTSITNTTSGRTLKLDWAGGNHVHTVSTDAPTLGGTPLVWTYNYTGDQLNSVCAPGAAPNCTTYTYQQASHYRSSVADDNPIAYWRLDGNANDTFPSAVTRHPGGEAATGTGVLAGLPGALGSDNGTAIQFDGQGSYVALPDGLVGDSMSLAVELWFKTTGSGALMSFQDKPFVDNPTSAQTPTQATPVLYVGVDGMLYGGFSTRDQGGAKQVVTTQAVNDGKWHHAVLTAAVNKQTLYVDGHTLGSIDGYVNQKQQGSAVLGTGRSANYPSTNGGNFYFQGQIDEPAIYQHSLGDLAVADHFAAAQPLGVLSSVTLPQDQTRRYAALTYDVGNDRVSTLLDHNGLQWTLDTPTVTSTQDTREGRPRWINPVRTVVLHGPSARGNWKYTFDAGNGGRLSSVQHNTDRARTYSYNDKGFQSAMVDEDGYEFDQTTDDRGNVLSRKSCRDKADAKTCNSSYYSYVTSTDPLDPRRDKLASSSDARSADDKDTTYRTSYDYDSLGRLITTTLPVPVGQTAHPTVVNTFAQAGQVPAVGGGFVPAGLLLKTVAPGNQTTTYAYQLNGDRVGTTSPTGLVTTVGYDRIGRMLTSQLGNDGGGVYGTTTYAYNGRGQIATKTDPTVTNPITSAAHAQVTSYGYDGDGNIVSTTVGDTLAVDKGGDQPRTTTFVFDAHDRLTTTKYPDGGIQQTSYSDDGLTVRTTDVNGTTYNYFLDAFGHTTGTTMSGPGVDPSNPNATSLTIDLRGYTAAGRLQSSNDAIGRLTMYGYYQDGLLSTVTKEGTSLEKRGYDGAGNLTMDVTVGGITTVSTYDPAGNLASTTLDPDKLKRTTTYLRDANGNPTTVSTTGAADPSRTETTRIGYDAGNQVTRQDVTKDGQGNVISTTFVRDPRELPTIASDGRGVTTSFSYDSTGQLVNTTHPPADVWSGGRVISNASGVDTLGRNTFGEVTQSRDQAGGVTVIGRDTMGRAVTTTPPPYTPPGATSPVTATTTTDYDHLGQAIKVTDPLGRVTSTTYNPYGQVTTVTAPQVGDTPSVTVYGYDKLRELNSKTDPTGAVTSYTYDNLGRRATTTQADRSSGRTLYYTTLTGYDDAGNLTSVTTPQGHVSKATYNAAGKVLTATDAAGLVTTTTYDNAGRPATVTSPTGLVTTSTYDLAGRLTQSAQSMNGQQLTSASVGYDDAGNLLSTTSPQGRKVEYGYDLVNRVVQQIEHVDPTKSITTTTGYDAVGDLSHHVDGNGHATDYTFTPWCLPESTVEPATTAYPNFADRTFTSSYDAAGQLRTISEPGGVTRTRDYDAQGRMTLEHGTGGGSSTPDRKLGYDLDNRITTVGSPGGDTTYRYDDRGNLLGYTGPATSGTYTYNGDNTMATRADAAGTTTFGYDNDDRLASVADPITGRTFGYGYNSGGQLVSASDTSVNQTTNRIFTYDPLGRLASDQLQKVFDPNTPPSALLGQTYHYDLDGKLTSRTDITPTTNTDNTFGYDGAGRLKSWNNKAYVWDDAGNRLSAGGPASTYNERNQLLSDGTSTYSYTARGTLASTTTGSNTVTSTFDAFDRETAQGVIQYSYDAADRVTARNGTAFTYDGLTNSTVTDGSRIVSLLPNGMPLSDKASTAVSGMSLFTNQHGDVVGRYRGGTVVSTQNYDPFGAVTSSTGEKSALGYQSGWTDPSTGQVDMAARWYSPGMGQFTTRDSWNLSPKPSWATNRYAYGNANPLNTTDPTGHVGECGIVGGVIAGVAGEVVEPIGGGALTWEPGVLVGEGICDGVEALFGVIALETALAYPDTIPMEHAPATTAPALPWWPDDAIPRGNCRYFTGGCSGQFDTGAGTQAPPRVAPSLSPPPPPRWVVDALTQGPRPPAGSTAIPRLPAQIAFTASTAVSSFAQQQLNQATHITTIGPNSQLYQQTQATIDPQLAGGTQLGSDPNDQTCDPWVFYGPLRPGTKQASGIVARLCGPGGSFNPLAQTGTKAGRGDRYAPPGYDDPTFQPRTKAHLLPKQFGGIGMDPDPRNPNSPRALQNLVGTYAEVNQVAMKNVEDQVGVQLAAGEHFYYVVAPSYVDGGKPTAIHMFAVGDQGSCVDVTITNTPIPVTYRGPLC